MKTCTKCKQEKPYTNFHNNGKYLRSQCKLCINQIRQIRYANNTSLMKHRDRMYTQDHWEQYLVSISKRRAKLLNLDHNITIEDIIIPNICPYLGLVLTRILGKGYIPTNASLDRIDNTKGYIKGNVQIVSRVANVMKSSATEKQLLDFANNVLAIHES